LDEPTNHLDIDAVNALIIALNNYQGGIIIVIFIFLIYQGFS
jgi:ATP-binding cassette subfamily F protein 3